MLKMVNLLKKGLACIAAIAFSASSAAFAYDSYEENDNGPVLEYGDEAINALVSLYDKKNYDVTVRINDEEVFFEDAEPYREYFSYLVPLRETFEKLGYGVEWNDEEKSVIITKGDYTAECYIQSWDLYINGEKSDEHVFAGNEEGTLVISADSLSNIDNHISVYKNTDGIVSIFTLTDSEVQAAAEIEEEIYKFVDKYEDRFEQLTDKFFSAGDIFNDEVLNCESDEEAVAALLSAIKEEDIFLECVNEAKQLINEAYGDIEVIFARAPRGYSDYFEALRYEYPKLEGFLNGAADFLEGRIDEDDVLEMYREYKSLLGIMH